DPGWFEARMDAASARGRGLARKPADAGPSRHLPDRTAGRCQPAGQAVRRLDVSRVRGWDPFSPLVRNARRRREVVGPDRYRPCAARGPQTLAATGVRPTRSAAPPT